MTAPPIPLTNPAFPDAIDWMVLLRSGEATESDQQAFECWYQADPGHRAAWEHVSGTLDHTFQPLRAGDAHAEAARRALLAPTQPEPQRRSESTPGRRKIQHGLLALAVLVSSSWLANQYTPILELTADLHTGTDERRAFTLPDGSTVTLGARSSADISFDSHERRVRLRSGELVASIVPDDAHPFVVETQEGNVHAAGRKVMVRQEAQRSFAVALDQDATVTTRQGERAILHEGEAAYFESLHVARPRPRASSVMTLGNRASKKNLS